MRNRMLIIVFILVLVSGTVLALTVDTVNRIASTSTLTVDWDDTNPEAIVDIRWNGSPNLTNQAVIGGCPDALEFFGNSWVSQDEGTPDSVFQSIVGWGTTGSWSNPNPNSIAASSVSTGCPASANIPVETNYRFFDRGAPVNRIQVRRQFDFGSTPYPYDFRPYIPRMYPMSDYNQVLHPDSGGSTLVTETTVGCDFGCRVDNWNDTWFAIHNPATGSGLIVRHESSSYDVALWIDQDSASFTNSSSMLALQPSGGFTGQVSDTMFLCFYDSSTWTPGLSLPAGC